jgi:hypothetical protein
MYVASPSQHFYVQEPALLKDHQLFIPLCWVEQSDGMWIVGHQVVDLGDHQENDFCLETARMLGDATLDGGVSTGF